MTLASQAADSVYMAAIDGAHGNFLKPGIDAYGGGIDPVLPTRNDAVGYSRNMVWTNVWPAGGRVGSIRNAPGVRRRPLCGAEYRDGVADAAADLAWNGARTSILFTKD
jgi:hypothetical protein